MGPLAAISTDAWFTLGSALAAMVAGVIGVIVNYRRKARDPSAAPPTRPEPVSLEHRLAQIEANQRETRAALQRIEVMLCQRPTPLAAPAILRGAPTTDGDA